MSDIHKSLQHRALRVATAERRKQAEDALAELANLKPQILAYVKQNGVPAEVAQAILSRYWPTIGQIDKALEWLNDGLAKLLTEQIDRQISGL